MPSLRHEPSGGSSTAEVAQASLTGLAEADAQEVDAEMGRRLSNTHFEPSISIAQMYHDHHRIESTTDDPGLARSTLGSETSRESNLLKQLSSPSSRETGSDIQAGYNAGGGSVQPLKLLSNDLDIEEAIHSGMTPLSIELGSDHRRLNKSRRNVLHRENISQESRGGESKRHGRKRRRTKKTRSPGPSKIVKHESFTLNLPVAVGAAPLQTRGGLALRRSQSQRNAAVKGGEIEYVEYIVPPRRLNLEDVKPEIAFLHFTTKQWTGCSCCPRRVLQVGDIVFYAFESGSSSIDGTSSNRRASVGAVAGVELSSASATSNLEFKRGMRRELSGLSPSSVGDADGCLVEVTYIHASDGSVDVIDEEDVERKRVPRARLLFLPSEKDNGGVTGVRRLLLGCQNCGGCIYVQSLEIRWQNALALRSKIKLRAASFLFVLVNILLMVNDFFYRHDQVEGWVTAGWNGTAEYEENPFCSHEPQPMKPEIVKLLDAPQKVSNNLLWLRSVGIVIPALCVTAFSMTQRYNDHTKRVSRMLMTYLCFLAMGGAVGFVTGYSFSYWYQVSFLRRGQRNVRKLLDCLTST